MVRTQHIQQLSKHRRTDRTCNETAIRLQARTDSVILCDPPTNPNTAAINAPGDMMSPICSADM